MAVSDGDEVAVEELLKHGADANVFENDGWYAPAIRTVRGNMGT
jgi:hypothetical protein